MKEVRFRRPEFQAKLRSARKYERKPDPTPSTLREVAFRGVGLRTRLGQGAAVLLLFLIVYFLVVSKVFLVDHAVIHSGRISSDEVAGVLLRLRNERFWLVPVNHWLVLTRGRLTEGLQKSYPEVRRITQFKKLFPPAVEIEVEMREPKFIWESGEAKYLLDQDGIVFERLKHDDLPAADLIVIRDFSGAALRVGQSAEAEKPLAFINNLTENWHKDVNAVEYRGFEVPTAKSLDIFARTDIGFLVYFDLNRPADIQLRNLDFVLRREINSETYGGLSYIDLRLPSLAYYCYKDAPCASEYATSTIETIKQ